VRSYKELENFLWCMKQYFSMAKINMSEQIYIIVMYLTGNAKLQWRTGTKEDLNVDVLRLRQGIVSCTSWLAWEELKKLKQD
jgi:hypothetical protein